MKRPAASMQIILGIVFGVCIGAGVALILGSGGLWLAVGLVIGIAIGAVMARKNKEIIRENQRPMANEHRLTTSLK